MTQEGLQLPDQADGPCKAKARHVMKSFSETGAEFNYATNGQRNGLLRVASPVASMRWLIGHLDFTQAFHSGNRIQRELYAEVPPEGVPGTTDRQLLRLLKTCYGLTDGTNTYPGSCWNLDTRKAGLILACSFYQVKEAEKSMGSSASPPMTRYTVGIKITGSEWSG